MSTGIRIKLLQHHFCLIASLKRYGKHSTIHLNMRLNVASVTNSEKKEILVDL